jgi:O-antigen biosynthesis protein
MNVQAAPGYRPSRRVASHSLAPWFRGNARRVVLLFWWTLTLQLPRQFGFWLRARRMRRAAPVQPGSQPRLIHSVDPRRLRIPRDDNPVVSIIIPTYGQVDYTLRCLASIADERPQAPIEVIVIDDATPGTSTACLAGIHGIRLVINPRNLGFLGSCNAAARVADGEFVLFLNNDTQVLSGWLDQLLAVFRSCDDVGAVGSKLLYPDGRLQEAGCIVWDDGSGWNYGKLDDPDRPAYNYRREVDYCSAASLMVPRALFNRVGGFDACYAPAYCEDSDLAFRLRERGYKVIYQPRSQVVHFEGISHGKDLTSGIKTFQSRNQHTFQERWQPILSREHLPNGAHVMRARDRARKRDIILVIDHYVPEPDRDAGSRTMLCCIQALLQAGLVVKFWPQNLRYSPGYTAALQDIGVEVAYGGDSDAFSHWLADNAHDIDYVLLSRPQVAAAFLADLKRHRNIRLLYYGHDLHFCRMRAQAKVLGDSLIAREADRMEQLERSVWRQVDVVMYPSDAEIAEVIALEPQVTARTLLPYCFADFATLRTPAAEPLILFVGSFGHPPNQEAVLWFASHVLPLICARVPDARLAIVGSNPSPDVKALAGEAISVSANVSAVVLREFYRAARVAAVPLRYGAGVKLKVVEAMREGLPLVTTSTGAQGLPGLERIVSVCDEPEAFADAICRLLTDDALWTQRCTAQIAYVASRFSETAFRGALLDALSRQPSIA